MATKTRVRGQITYDNYFGHVCTCTARDVEGHDADGNAVAVFTEYEPTVSADRDSATETGSYWYSCSRCGAGAWSGL